jgi:hypothetical protein
MASTGLLGFNPYGGGVVLDISSKPAALAIQLEQKEAAKREVLQRYLMDYERSLNPAGMRSIDQDAFLGKLNEAKQYNLKNTQQILNPAKYGSQWQSNYLGLLKEAQGIIEESKVQGADDKIVNQNIYQATQKGQTLHDGLLPSIEASRRSIRDPKFKKVNLLELKFDEKYDDSNLMKNVWAGITLPTRSDKVKEILPSGEVIYQKESYLTPNIIGVVTASALSDFTTKPGAAKHFNDLMKQPQIYSFANDAFGKAYKYFDPAAQKEVKPNIGDNVPGLNLDPTQQFVAGYALAKKPMGEVSSTQPVMPFLTKFKLTKEAADKRQRISDANADRRALLNLPPAEMEGNELDNIEDIVFSTGGGVKNGVATYANGNPWSGEVSVPKNKISGLLFHMIGADPKDVVVTYKNGEPVKMVHPQVGSISRNAIINYQLKFNTEPGKGQQLKFGRDTGTPSKKKKGAADLNN